MRGGDRAHRRPGAYTVYRCRACGTVFLWPLPGPEAFGELYPEDYVPYGPAVLTGLQRWLYDYGVDKQVRAVLREASGQPGRALDVGCARGDFLAGLRRRGWQVQGLELNGRIAAEARARNGLAVDEADFMHNRYPDAAFDLVSFWDVLEHLADPPAALREAARIARPGALLVISVPDPESLEAGWFGPAWAGWDMPRHFWLFPQAVMRRLLAEAGWEVQAVRHFRGRHWLLVLSLRLWLEARAVAPGLQRVLLGLAQSAGARVLLLPYFEIVERLGRGSIMVFFARRREGESDD